MFAAVRLVGRRAPVRCRDPWHRRTGPSTPALSGLSPKPPDGDPGACRVGRTPCARWNGGSTWVRGWSVAVLQPRPRKAISTGFTLVNSDGRAGTWRAPRSAGWYTYDGIAVPPPNPDTGTGARPEPAWVHAGSYAIETFRLLLVFCVLFCFFVARCLCHNRHDVRVRERTSLEALVSI